MAFICLLLYIIAIYLRPQEWVPGIQRVPLIYLLSILCSIFVFLDLSKQKKIILDAPANILILVYFFCIVMSHLSHTYFQGLTDSLKTFSPNVLLFFICVNLLNKESKLKVLIWFIVSITLVLSLEGIMQHYKGIGLAGQTPLVDLEREETRIRWIGIFDDPNDLALVFIVGIGFVGSFMIMTKKVLLKILCVCVVLLFSQALFFTNSRGGFLALATMVIFFFLKKVKNKIFALSAGILFAIVIILVGPSRMSELDASEASAYGRIDAWYEGFEMIKSAPVFGVGHRLFTDYHVRSAHNSYISVAAEVGLVGYFFWMAFIYACFKGLVACENKNPAFQPYVIGLECGLIGFFSASFFLSRSDVMVLYLLLAFAAAFAYTLCEKKEEYILKSSDWKRIVILSLGMLFLVWVSMKFSI